MVNIIPKIRRQKFWTSKFTGLSYMDLNHALRQINSQYLTRLISCCSALVPWFTDCFFVLTWFQERVLQMPVALEGTHLDSGFFQILMELMDVNQQFYLI